MLAFKPKKFIFLKACANCEYGKPVTGAVNTPLGYICTKKEGAHRLFGSHICDVEIDGTGNQISWFDELKEND